MRRSRAPRGYSFPELVTVMAVAGCGLLIAAPVAQGIYAGTRIHTAGQEAAMTFRLARISAIRSGRQTAVRVEINAQGYRLGIYRDGNGNGVLTRDITRGIDPPAPGAHGWDRGDVTVSILGTVRVPDPSSPGHFLDPTDPVRFNSSNLCSFSPLGECTPGSLYLSDGRSRMAVVRVYNRTGRIRVLYYTAGKPRWEES